MRLLKLNNKLVKNSSNNVLHSKTTVTLLTGLVDYWNFNSNANTATGTGHNGTVTGATNTTAKIGNGYSFTGTNVINVGNTSTYNFIHKTAVFSVSFWMKMTNYAADNARMVLVNNRGASAEHGFNIYYDNRTSTGATKSIGFNVTRGIEGQPTFFYSTSPNVITDNNWHHVVATSAHQSGSNNIYIYVDGVKVSGSLSYNYPTIDSPAAAFPMNIGNNNAGVNYNMEGLLDEIGIWNRCLMHEEVIKLYNAGSGLTYPF